VSGIVDAYPESDVDDDVLRVSFLNICGPERSSWIL